MKAWHRVYCALRRCSEQRWLSPREVVRLGYKFAFCCSGRPHHTMATEGKAHNFGRIVGMGQRLIGNSGD